MINPQFFCHILQEKKIEFFAGVPDSLLKEFGNFVSSTVPPTYHTIAANEGSAVALGIGHHLATGKIPLVYMQNSGLGNTVNPLISLADSTVYSIPMLLLIGWRGEPNVADEPQHKKQGPITPSMLEAMDIPFTILHKDLSADELTSILHTATDYCQNNQAPYALVVKKGTFAQFTLEKPPNELSLTREQAIACVMQFIKKEDVVVATTGMIARELYEQREIQQQGHQQDFLVIGGMGHCSSIALRIAVEKPHRTVYCLDGDGAALMHLGSMAINGTSGCENFKHIVLNNGVHDSVGGQPTVGLKVDLPTIARSCHYQQAQSVKTAQQLQQIMPTLQQQKGPCFLQVCVKSGNRSDLGRPKHTPQECKQQFMQHLSQT